MKLDRWALGTLAVGAVVLSAASAAPSVYPTGVTIYDPARTWNGYTVLSPLATQAVLVIDMNGNVVKRWDDFNNSAGGPARVLPGGGVIAASGARPPFQESLELVQRDFAGNVIWSFNRSEQIELRDRGMVWSSRQHHDWQREDFPAGYYSPEATPATTGSNTLILTHTNHVVPAVADVMLEDDRLIEVTPDGRIVWEWTAARAHRRARLCGRRARRDQSRGRRERGAQLVRLAAHQLGDLRRAESVVRRRRSSASHRPTSSSAAAKRACSRSSRRDGSIVWRLGPDFSASEELRKIRQIIGQHHAHLIPKGLPGAGHVLVFDNGGSSGYGFAGPIAPNGVGAFARATSRVLEINPVTLELVWSYAAPRFFSTNISGAQRLAERQYARHRRRRRPRVRGHERRHDRLGIHEPVVRGAAVVERRLPRVSVAVRLAAAARASKRARGHAAGARRVRVAVARRSANLVAFLRDRERLTVGRRATVVAGTQPSVAMCVFANLLQRNRQRSFALIAAWHECCGTSPRI